MLAVDWERARGLFEAALELETEDRQALLVKECGDDTALRDEVETLLRANEQAGDFIERPAVGFSSPSDAAEAGDFLVGQRIGAYKLLREIGHGGMGEVFLASRDDGEFKKMVAIKLVRQNLRADDVARFKRERQILANLDHPHIARLLDGGTTADGRPYVVMEYVEGSTLRQLLDQQGPLSLDQTVAIGLQICSALAAAHEKGIVHRDVKPGNIIITEGRQIKVVDFGIAKLEEVDEAVAHTQTGAILGTASYMSPEQAAGAKRDNVDARADIYSAGMLMYEMLTGRVAFVGDSWPVVLNKHLHESPTPPRQLRPNLEISPAVEKVVLKALEKDRSRRQQSIHELAADLEIASRQPASHFDSVTAQLKRAARTWFRRES